MAMNKFIVGSAILILLVIIGISVANVVGRNGGEYSNGGINAPNPTTGGQNTGAGTGEVQNAKLALVDFSYKLTPNQIVVGVPVRIEVDASTLSGCMTTVVIRDFGVTKRIRPGDNIIEFTPDKTGKFWITCGMGMGPGSFEVVNSDGTADAKAATANSAPPASTCGGPSGGGGCGCGGG